MSAQLKMKRTTPAMKLLVIAGTLLAWSSSPTLAQGTNDFSTKPYGAGELVVDPNGLSDSLGGVPSMLDNLEVAIVSAPDKHWRVLKGSVQASLLAGHNSTSIRVLNLSRVRDLNNDGVREYLVTLDLAAGREVLRTYSGLHLDAISIEYVSSSKSPGSQQRRILSFERTVPLNDAPNCFPNFENFTVVSSVTCSFTFSAAPLNLLSTVNDVNTQISEYGVEIPMDATVVIEATGGRGPLPRKIDFSCIECDTGAPGNAGYAATATSFTDLSALLWIYVGEVGPGDTFSGSFAGGSSTIVSTTALENTEHLLHSPREAGILLIAGGGGSGGGVNHSCPARFDPFSRPSCDNGSPGGDGGQAALSTEMDVSAPGGGPVANKHSGGGGNKDGMGSGGTGANKNDSRNGTAGIGGYGGVDKNTSDAQTFWTGSSITDWPFGLGGKVDGSRGNAAGGGGFGGGGGAGGNSSSHRGGGGGGGSWAIQSTVSPAGMLRGAFWTPVVSITFSVVDIN